MSSSATRMQETRGIKPCQKFSGHTDWVTGVIHLPDGKRIMTSSWDGSPRVWNFQSGKQISNGWQNEELYIGHVIALSPDGQKIVSKSGMWDIDAGKLETKWTEYMGIFESVCWNRDSGRVMSGFSDGTAREWDVESGKIVRVIETGIKEVNAIIFSPDSTMFATGGGGGGAYPKEGEKDEFLKIWDAKTGELVTNLKGHTWTVFCLAWTPDGKTLISGSFDPSIMMWNTTTWQQIAVLTGHTNAVRGIAISPNGRILASASWDNTAQLWNLENGQPIGSPLQHADRVDCVSFSTDGKLLATGCWDNNAYSWDISVIVREAGLDELLLPNDGDKSLLDADATRRLNQPRENAHRLPPGFLDDSRHRPHPSRSRRPFSSSAHHETPARQRFLEWARNSVFNSPSQRNDEGIEFQEHSPAVVHVPFAQGNHRNYSAREVRMKKKKEQEKARDAKNKKNTKSVQDASSDSSRPQQSDVPRQSGGVVQSQLSSELHAAVSTFSPAPAVAAASATASTTSLPDAVIERAGRWTRFWLYICCMSA